MNHWLLIIRHKSPGLRYRLKASSFSRFIRGTIILKDFSFILGPYLTTVAGRSHGAAAPW